MKLFLVILLSVASVLAVEYSFEDGVAVLNERDFDYAFAKFRYVLVQFYTADSVTNETQAQYAQTAQKVSETIPGVTLCKFNVTNDIKYKDAYQLHKFPTLKFFIKTKEDPRDYDGDGTTDDIIDWIREQLETLTIKVNTNEELEKVVLEEEDFGFYFGSDTSNFYKDFLSVIPSFDDVAFVRSDSDAIKERYAIKGDKFVMVRNHGEEKTIFMGKSSVQALKNFIETYKLPLILPADIFTPNYLRTKNRDVVFFFKNSDELSAEEEVFRMFAWESREKIGFAVISTKGIYGNVLLKLFNLKEDKLPVVTSLRLSAKKQRYILGREVTEKDLKVFLENFLQDNLMPQTKSDSLPSDQYDGEVRVVVQKNYREVVMDETKDVLIEFYSPYCGHCTHFAPTYAEVGKAFSDIEDMIIAKIDATKNEVEDVVLKGYPTVVFYPREKKDNPIEYHGNRSKDDVIKFIKEHATVEIDE